MEVDYLQAVVTVDVTIAITFPKGTLDQSRQKIANGDVDLVYMYRDIIKNQMNMQLHQLPTTAKISVCNLKELEEEPEPRPVF